MYLIPRRIHRVLRELHRPACRFCPNYSIGDLCFLVFFLVIEVVICINPIVNAARGDSLSEIGRSMGSPVQWNMAGLLIPLTKRVSPMLVLLNVPFERGVRFHRWVAYAAIITTILHFFFLVFDNDMAEFSNVAGLIAMGSFLLIFLTSLEIVRRTLYELFFRVHVSFALLAYIFAMIHQSAGGLIARCAAPAVLYLGDLALRMFITVRRRGVLLHCTTICPDMQKVVHWEVLVERGKGVFVEAGQYAYLYVPSLAWAQMHPFSVAYARQLTRDDETVDEDLKKYLASMPPEDKSQCVVLGFFVRELGNYTLKFPEVQSLSKSKHPRVWVDGPFGSCALDLSQYKTFVMIAGGIGITSIISFWNSVVLADNPRSYSVYNAKFHPEAEVIPQDDLSTAPSLLKPMDTASHSTDPPNLVHPPASAPPKTLAATATPSAAPSASRAASGRRPRNISVSLHWTLRGCDIGLATAVLERLLIAPQTGTLGPVLRIHIHVTQPRQAPEEALKELNILIARFPAVMVTLCLQGHRIAPDIVLSTAVKECSACPPDLERTLRVGVLACGPTGLLTDVRAAGCVLTNKPIPPYDKVVFDVHTESFAL
ncbi:mitochondrial ferric reductase [Andalucia godoyi]|uniref:Mitochondrial ferric reductase n=1 Tax=Andalucia godoyi TaxID=505711 RepID=A0A8K0AH51_ANDGO|nr:mitochondrial ferric reductase [Andalucia godoyi]|eukprot:ANDGO_01674.mRNA.1 mitochondrial ferric reductase